MIQYRLRACRRFDQSVAVTSSSERVTAIYSVLTRTKPIAPAFGFARQFTAIIAKYAIFVFLEASFSIPWRYVTAIQKRIVFLEL